MRNKDTILLGEAYKRILLKESHPNHTAEFIGRRFVTADWNYNKAWNANDPTTQALKDAFNQIQNFNQKVVYVESGLVDNSESSHVINSWTIILVIDKNDLTPDTFNSENSDHFDKQNIPAKAISLHFYDEREKEQKKCDIYDTVIDKVRMSELITLPHSGIEAPKKLYTKMDRQHMGWQIEEWSVVD